MTTRRAFLAGGLAAAGAVPPGAQVVESYRANLAYLRGVLGA